jgi:hypothetical protein
MSIPADLERPAVDDSIVGNPVGEWQWEAESRAILESLVSKALSQKTNVIAIQSNNRISQWIGAEKSTLELRLAAIEQAALDRRKSWDNQLKSISDNIRELDTDSQRTARGSAIVR